jgi:hypothetical protein
MLSDIYRKALSFDAMVKGLQVENTDLQTKLNLAKSELLALSAENKRLFNIVGKQEKAFADLVEKNREQKDSFEVSSRRLSLENTRLTHSLKVLREALEKAISTNTEEDSGYKDRQIHYARIKLGPERWLYDVLYKIKEGQEEVELFLKMVEALPVEIAELKKKTESIDKKVREFIKYGINAGV